MALEQILLAVASYQDPTRCLCRNLVFEIYGRKPNALKVGSRYIDKDQMVLRIR